MVYRNMNKGVAIEKVFYHCKNRAPNWNVKIEEQLNLIFLYIGAGLPIPCPVGKLRMTVKSTVNTPQPPINLAGNPVNRKLPLQTIINNNLWQSKAIR